jgi:hypothetical protein
MRSKATLLRAGIGIATILLLAIPPLVTEASARGGFGGGGGAHIGGGGRGSFQTMTWKAACPSLHPFVPAH